MSLHLTRERIHETANELAESYLKAFAYPNGRVILLHNADSGYLKSISEEMGVAFRSIIERKKLDIPVPSVLLDIRGEYAKTDGGRFYCVDVGSFLERSCQRKV